MRKACLILALTFSPFLVSAQSPLFNKSWVNTWGGPDNYGLGRGVAIDDSGNVYVAGSTTVNGYFTGVVVKYAPDGQYLWHRFATGTPHALAADSNGVYVTGTTYSGSIGYIVTNKILPDGGYGWSDWYTLSNGAGASDIAVDRLSNVYVSGWGRTGDSAKSYRMVVLKYANSGVKEWAVLDSVRTYIERVALAVNESGVYICIPDHGVTYLVSYGLGGNHRWSVRHGKFGAYWPGYYGDISLDKEGNVYFTSCIARDTMANVDLLVGAYTGDGAFLWDNTWICSAAGVSTGRAMALDDSTGSIYVTGLYYPDRTENVKRAVLIKYTVQGSQPWVRTYAGTAAWDSFDDVAADHDGNAYVAGFTDIGGAAGSKNLLMKFDAGGTVKWSDNHTITGGDDVWSSIVVDHALNVYVGGNVTTTWNPYTILLAAAKYSQKGFFRPARDGWQFANEEEIMWPPAWWSQFHYNLPPYPINFTKWPINAKSSDFPDWPLFVEAFGEDQCYFPAAAPGSHIWKPSAILYWRDIVTEWNGSCFGFATSSLLIFNDYLYFEEMFPGFNTLFQVPLSDRWRRTINRYFLYQNGKTNNADYEPLLAKTPNETAQDLISMMAKQNPNRTSLSLYNNHGSGAHEVVPCSLKTGSPDPDVVQVTIYDSNSPGIERMFSIDTVANTWSYDGLPGWGGSKQAFLGLDIIRYTSKPDIEKAGIVVASAEPVLGTDSTHLILYVTPGAGCMVSDGNGGALGYDPSDSSVTATMANAHPIILRTGRASPPIGYILPLNTYEVRAFSPPDTILHVRAMGNSIIAAYEEHGIQLGEKALLRLSETGDTLVVRNPENRTRNGMLRSIRVSPDREMACDIADMAIPGSDSLAIALTEGSSVKLHAGSSSSTYTLALSFAAPCTSLQFLHRGVALSGGSTHRIAPDWERLDSIPVHVFVDLDGDGTPDDTLTLANEVTDVSNPRGAIDIPNHFRLEQNYPNPFNSTTTIRYGLPIRSVIHLSVYNILGQEVATLVREEMGAGYHEVKFDASSLSSGVYVYRLHAGNFVQSRKLLLLR